MKKIHQLFFVSEKVFPIRIGGINKKCKVNKSVPWITISLQLRGYIEKGTSLFLVNNIKKGDVFLDIGANLGYYSLIASELVGDEGKVYAFEPVKSNIKSLEENILLNNISNVSIKKFALGNKNEQLNINIDANNSAVNSIVIKQDKNLSEKISIKRFDDLDIHKENINFVKIDVEGYELEVLKGMKNLLENQDNLNIVMEFSPLFFKQIGETPEKIIEYIYKIGYSTYKITSTGQLKKINLKDYLKIYQMNILLKKELKS
ncbi:FkbM family methyltransferase [Candidatus Absconditicoccus praedator]|uniref:FkbM family methyltransferase n=1 Tax=Candidatus Absconditicoccus praedator TaxID=2735562 RepID=UPI001E3E536F|nr:FkbM family methyltransferase [Candidatus Absconditicoccus praedator]UFX82739.1 FkbM family methyltransferase [Candidatus Absconditicoccus praedator]